MALYIANENGDWWQFDERDVLYILDTDNLPEEVAKEWQDENGDVEWVDDFLIWEYGKPVSQSKLIH